MNKLIGSTLLLTAMVLIAVFGVACDTTGPKRDDTGTLSGVVLEAGSETPLTDVTVALGSAETTTDQDGRFVFREVPVGLQTLQMSTAGFDAYSQQINVQVGDNALVIFLPRTSYWEFNGGRGDGNYGIYLPPGVSTYRGVIFLGNGGGRDVRGFASGIPRTTGPGDLNLFNELVAVERRRALRLAEKYELALMGAQAVQFSLPGVLKALSQIADESDHPELVEAPLLMMGFSFGGCFAYEFARMYSDRTIGFMTQKGNCHVHPDAGPAQLVPGYLFIGGEDSFGAAANITRLFEENRSQGALWALAIEEGAAHTPIPDDDLLYQWMDTVLEARLPETASPGAPVVLRAIDEASGWLGHQSDFSTAEYACYEEDRLEASWLPSMQTAQDWQAFVSESSVTTVTPCANTP